jgi:hypothetical protein
MGVFMQAKFLFIASLMLATVTLQGCKHPLAIVGEGDIVDANNSGRGCTLEQFRAKDAACTENQVSGGYSVNYMAVPRPGWRFVRWEGPCSGQSQFQHCSFDLSAEEVTRWDKTYPDVAILPSTAVFQPVTGETGYLLAGTPVAGVAYETATQQGVTGLDGSFQYEEGETVRFMIGATLLGEVTGQDQVTPFELAGSAVLIGIDIAWALMDDEDPFQTIVNLAVLLHSVDSDVDPTNGIEIRPSVANLLSKVKLDVRQRADRSLHASDPEGETIYLAQDWETFYSDPTFRHILGLANRKHRFSTPHGIVSPKEAMANLYNSVGIDPRIVGLTLKESRDPDNIQFDRFTYEGGGNITRHESSDFDGAYETWQYDTKGNVIQHEQHADQFNHHLLETWHYDENGNAIQSKLSGNSGFYGATERIRTGMYDIDDNQLEKRTVDTRESGTTREFFGTSYAYDHYGRLVQYNEERNNQHADSSAFHSLESFGYAHYTDGNLKKITRTLDAPEPDGAPENSQLQKINKYGNVTRYESMLHGGHVVTTWTYDSDGKVTRFLRGSIVWIFQYEYDADGNITRRERINTSDDAVEEIVTWKYDDVGNMVLKETQVSGQAALYSGIDHSLESWQYHTNNIVKLHTFEASSQRSDRGAFWDEHQAGQYEYDINENLTGFERQTTLQGDLDLFMNEIRNWRYNAAGNLTRESIKNDGETQHVKTWDYDSDGNLTRYKLDQGGDDTIEIAETYHYETTGWGHLFSKIEIYGYNYATPLKPSPNLGN